VVIFLAYNSVQALEASVNKAVGAAAVGMIYLGLVMGNLIAPAMLEVLFKNYIPAAMGFGGFTYTLFIFSSIYPKYWLMLPSALLMGFGGAVMWTAQASSMFRFARYVSYKEQLDRMNQMEKRESLRGSGSVETIIELVNHSSHPPASLQQPDVAAHTTDDCPSHVQSAEIEMVTPQRDRAP